MQKQIRDLPEQQPLFVSQKKGRPRLCESAFPCGQGRKNGGPVRARITLPNKTGKREEY